jgi:hypothetical protein
MSRTARLLQPLLRGLLLVAAMAASGAQIKFDLGQYAEGQLPQGFSSLVTGQGPPGDWKIMEEKVAPVQPSLLPSLTNSYISKHSVLAQTSELPLASHFPLLLYTNEVLANFTITTRFEIISGAVAPEAGVAFRVQDRNNYYVVRASARGNVLWYRVVGGVRHEDQGIGVKIPIQTGAWYELSVVCSGNQIRCLLDGKLIIPPARAGAATNELAINDSTFATGQAGLWTASDTVAYFADTRIDYTPRVPMIQTVVAEVIKKYPRLLGLKIYSMKNSAVPVVIADAKGPDLGSPGGATETQVITNGTAMYLKLKDSVELTLPLRDRNGEIIAAMKVTLTSFKGETTDTAAGRASVIKKAMEERLNTLQEINQ